MICSTANGSVEDAVSILNVKWLDLISLNKAEATTREFRNGNYSSFATTQINGRKSEAIQKILDSIKNEKSSPDQSNENNVNRIKSGIDWHVNGYSDYKNFSSDELKNILSR